MVEDDAVLNVSGLKKYFAVRKSYLSSFFGVKDLFIKAVDDVSFYIKRGEVFGLVGESGCGKTTTGKTVLRLIEPTSGETYFEGKNIYKLNKSEMRQLRRKMQMIYQDPYDSMNPRMTVFNIISEPIYIHKLVKNQVVLELVLQSMKNVDLVPPEEFLNRYPHELSGGQRQRVAIARTLVLNPSFIVADEPVSMLDVSIRAGILNLMKDLIENFGMSYLFITHDLAIARYMCNRAAIMYLGKIVEMGSMERLVKNPFHPYTSALMAAVPVPDPTEEKSKVVVSGEAPTPINPPPGCRFHPRCKQAMTMCKEREAVLLEIEKNHYVACHQFK